MARRREARRQAIGILFQADLLGRAPREVLEERRALGEKVPGFAEELVLGVSERQDDLDAVIGELAQEWTVARLAPVVRAVLRVGAFELLTRDDVPSGAAIDEAVEATKDLASEEAARFVNGVLGAVARERVGGSPNA